MNKPTRPLPKVSIIFSFFNFIGPQRGPTLKLALDVHQQGRVEGVQRMVRISVTGSSPDTMTLLLEGQLIGEAVDELNLSCEQALANGRRLILDLAGVLFIDRKGVALFHRLANRNVSIVNCSGFVTELLKVRDPG